MFYIRYKVNGKLHTQEAKTSPLSFPQQQPGIFTVTSVAHHEKTCKAAVTDLRFNVHALPSAQVGHGKRIFQDIHEGDQAEIVFTLIGEPPFTITYQRAELPTKKGASPKVLETHTVSRIQSHEYSIFSAMEGTTLAKKLCFLLTFVSLHRNMDCNLGVRSLLSISPCSTRLNNRKAQVGYHIVVQS